MKLDILVYTHSSCIDVFDVFLSTLKLHVRDIDKYRLVVLTNSTDAAEIALKSNQIQNFIVLKYLDETKYFEHFEVLVSQIAPYFVYLQDDYFITAPFEFSSLERFVEVIRARDISFFRLTPSAARRSMAYLEYYRRKSKVLVDHEIFLRVDHLSSLPACMQPTIWRSEDFLSLHKVAKVGNLREEWSQRYRATFQELSLSGLASTSVLIPYIEVTAVRKGQWNFTDFRWGLVLKDILRSKGINPLDRGIAFYKHEVAEKKSTILHDIWRRIRY